MSVEEYDEDYLWWRYVQANYMCDTIEIAKATNDLGSV